MLAFFASGVFYYFPAEQVRALAQGMADSFPGGVLVFDAANRTAVKMIAKTWLKSRGSEKIGIAGASTTGTLALTAASIFSDISLTIAMTPSDFVWQGFMQGKKGACKEWPITEEEFITVENIRGMLKTMLPVGSALFVKLAFSAAKKYPGECKTARIDIDRRMTRVICDWRDKK